MSASSWDIWRHITNTVQRASYGENGKKHFKLQKERLANMAAGGHGGTPSNGIMVDTSNHEGTIRELHFNNWDDSDFGLVLEGIAHWETSEEIPAEPNQVQSDPVTLVVEQSLELFNKLERSDKIDGLNMLAEMLGVMEPESDTE